MSKTISLSPDVLAILQRSTATADRIVLPSSPLPRPLYVQVDKALQAIGCKWNTRQQAHLAKTDPRPLLQSLLTTGTVENEQQKWQSFYTPPILATQIVEVADVRGRSVLEPSAGQGALAKACLEQGAASLTAIEMNPTVGEELSATLHASATGSTRVLVGDFLTYEPGKTMSFDRVVMNPPFTRGSDIQHVFHALKFLHKGGMLTAIMCGSSARTMQHLIEEKRLVCGGYVEPLPAKSFRSAGTDVETLLCVLIVH